MTVGFAESDPIAIDLNVDAALVLQSMVGIDAYPMVLALLPNIYLVEDRDRVHTVVAQQLAEAGIIAEGQVHPMVEHWLHCLYRPDVELLTYVQTAGTDEQTEHALRLSLVRSADTHVLAVRCDDHVVIQSIYQQGRQLDAIAAAVSAALGPAQPVSFEPMRASAEQLSQISSDPSEMRQAFVELGAPQHSASVLSRTLAEVDRRAEIAVVQHRDGESVEVELALGVLEAPSGRIVATPSVGMDGTVWSTFAPGDDAAILAGITALVELLPGRSWFDTSRTD